MIRKFRDRIIIKLNFETESTQFPNFVSRRKNRHSYPLPSFFCAANLSLAVDQSAESYMWKCLVSAVQLSYLVRQSPLSVL